MAAGEALPLTQAEITRGGHAIEVRLCAENPSNNFLPETGRIGVLRAPHEVDEIVARSGTAKTTLADCVAGAVTDANDASQGCDGDLTDCLDLC